MPSEARERGHEAAFGFENQRRKCTNTPSVEREPEDPQVGSQEDGRCQVGEGRAQTARRPEPRAAVTGDAKPSLSLSTKLSIYTQ